jgi:hypothetical protein
MSKATPIGRQLLRDERKPRHYRIGDLTGETARCFKAGFFDAAVVMQFIELDTWAYLMRPPEMTRHGRASFKWFIGEYLQTDPTQEYQYRPEDAYASRCGALHTGGALSDLHDDASIAMWRFHTGKHHTYAPGMKGIAYISLHRFHMDAVAATSQCLADVAADHELNCRFARRMPRVFFQAGVLSSRDPDAIALLDPEIDALLAESGPE